MTDGLVISSIGLASVFAILVIIMLLVTVLGKLLRNGELSLEQAEAPRGGVEDEGGKAGTRQEVIADRVSMAAPVGAQESTASGRTRAGIEELPRPDGSDEVAAIALAVAAHMKKRGKELGGRQIMIEDAWYEVEVGDPSQSPVAVMVNGQRCWASLDGRGLPVAGRSAPPGTAHAGEARYRPRWRAAYPMAQAGYWDRRGWR